MKTNLKNRTSKIRKWTPQSEELEKRVLLVSDLHFDTQIDLDQDNTNGVLTSFEFASLDFSPGNALLKNFRSADPANPGLIEDSTGELLFQARLGNFLDNSSSVIQPNGGLNSNYEVTVVLTAAVQLDELITSGGAPLPQFFEFDEITNGTLQIFYDDTPDVNELAGSGFVDGVKILEANVADIDGNFSFNLAGNFPITSQYDQFPPNDPARDSYGGLLSVIGIGGTNVQADVTYLAMPGSLATDGNAYFFSNGGLSIDDLDLLNINFDNKLPFAQTEPAQDFFVGGAGTFAPYAPDLGEINGLPNANPNDSSDFQMQADANIAFELVPGSIHGFKFEDLNKNGEYEPSAGDKAWAGFEFELWKDANNSGTIDAGDVVVDTQTSHADNPATLYDETGEFWFEDVVPGNYVLREKLPTTPVNPKTGQPEVRSSTPIDRALHVCAREELVWRTGAAWFGEVVGRSIFYNNSYWDTPTAANPGFNNSTAIAPDKQAYLGGSGPNDFSNWTSYVRGINGIVVDILNGGTHGVISQTDFEFRVGKDNTPGDWDDAPNPTSISQQFDTPVAGVTRVFIEWPDGAIRDEHLQVIVKANGNTRIPMDDIHYWTNIVGEATGDIQPLNTTTVDGNDASFAFGTATGFGSAGITHHGDFDRNNVVDGNDATIAFDNATGFDPLNILDINSSDEQYKGEWKRFENVVGELVMFGNYVTGSIHGFKFDDYEADGVYDPNGWDLPFGGVTFELTGTNGMGMDITPITVVSDKTGQFWFHDLDPGTYTITEMPMPGDVMPSTPTVSQTITIQSRQEHVWQDGAAMLPTGSLKTEVLSNPNSDGIDTNLIFGNFVKGSIHGFKFEDLNANGTRDTTESGWAGIKFELHNSNAAGLQGTSVGVSTTDSAGEFWFTGLTPGYYLLRELLPPDLDVEYVPTRPTERHLWVGSREELVWAPGAANLANGALQHEILERPGSHPTGSFDGRDELVFGNYIPGSIHGFKCEDMNANGVCDVDVDGNRIDLGMPGVTIFLDGKDGMDNDVNLTTITDADGFFWFENLKPGTYTVSEKKMAVGFDDPSREDPDTLLPLNQEQGQLIGANGATTFPNDNVMESFQNSITLTVASRQEYVFEPGAGNLGKHCFRDNPGLIQVTGDITHQLCVGDPMPTHTVALDVPMPSNAYHVTELEVVNGYGNAALDGSIANWTSGDYMFEEGTPNSGVPNYTGYTSPGNHPLTGTGLQFTVRVVAGKINMWEVTSSPTNSLEPSKAYTDVATATNGAGSGATFDITVDANGAPSVAINAVGKDYAVGDQISIPFGSIGGQTSFDNIVIKVNKVESMFADLKTVNDNDGVGPDANINTGGKAYEVGDMFTITPPGAVVGDVLMLDDANGTIAGIQPVSQGVGYGAQTDPNPVTYLNVPAVEGNGLTFDVVIRDEQVESVILKTPGTGYTAGQLVTIDGEALASSPSADVKVRIKTVGDDRVMLKVEGVGNTTLDIDVMEMSDDWDQSTPPTRITIDSLTGGNATQRVTFSPGVKITGNGYDDVIEYNVKVDGAVFPGPVWVDGTKYDDGDWTIAVNNGTLRKEVNIGQDLVFENYVKGSIHGHKYHDKNLNGIPESSDEPFPGVEFSPKIAGAYVAPDINFDTVGPNFTTYFSTVPTVVADNGYGDGRQYLFYNGGAAASPAPGTFSNWTIDGAGHNNPNSAFTSLTDPVGSGTVQSALTLVAFTPFSAGIGFSRVVDSLDAGDSLSFYIDDQLKAIFNGDDLDGGSPVAQDFVDAWFDVDEGWGWHKYTWVASNDQDADDARSTMNVWLDDIRFTARSNNSGDFWIEDLRPQTYEVTERLDLIGQFQGEVMPSFMNVSQWASTVISSTTDLDINDANKCDGADDMADECALGAPDNNGWSAEQADHLGPQTIELEFAKDVYASSVEVHELGLGGAITKVEINNLSGGWVDITSLGNRTGLVSTYSFAGNMPMFQSDRVRVTINPDHDWATNTATGGFEKINAVKLDGMVRMKDSTTVTIKSGEEHVWQDNAANLPAPTLRDEVLAAANPMDANADNALTFSNLIKGSIHAFKYEDMIADGIYDPDVDTPWEGFKFELFTKDIFGDFSISLGTEVSDATGQVWFTGLKPLQDYKLVELGADFPTRDGEVMSSTGDEWIINDLPSGTEYVWKTGAAMLDSNSPIPKLTKELVSSGLQFGNYVKGSIHGFKFEDFNGDGVYDPNEDVPFGGVEFNLVGTSAWNNTVSMTGHSDQHGDFWFTDLIPGDYTISENPWTDTMSTNGGTREFTVLSRQELVWKEGKANLGSLPDTLKVEELVPYAPANGDHGLHFGNTVKGSIHGFKCHDVDADGVCETTNRVIFVIDVSDSMLAPITPSSLGADANDPFDDTPGDADNDGTPNTKLDSAVNAFIALNNELIASQKPNTKTEIILVAFAGKNDGTTSVNAIGVFTPTEDAFDGPGTGPADGVPDVQNILEFGFRDRTLVDGAIGTDTRLEEALEAAIAAAQFPIEGASGLKNPHLTNVYLLTDAAVNLGDAGAALGDEVATLKEWAGNVTADAIGTDVGNFIDNLTVIDPTAEILATDAEVIAGFNLGPDYNSPEMPMGGVQFRVTGVLGNGQNFGPVIVTTEADMTDPYFGEFWVEDLYPGDYTITELVPTGYTSSTHGDAAEYDVTIQSRQEYVWKDGAARLPADTNKLEVQTNGLIFGNFVKGSIHGFKFEDLNADGIYQGATEEGLAGVTFNLTGMDNQGNAVSLSTFSDAFGEFKFEDLWPGTYTVAEVVGSDFIATTPTSWTVTVESTQEYVWEQAVAVRENILAPKVVVVAGEDLMFGNVVRGSIHGFKFHDYNANNVYEALASGDILPGNDTDGDGDFDGDDDPNGKDVNADGFIDFYTDLDPAHPGLQTDRPWAGFNFEIWKDANGNGTLETGVDTHITTVTSGTDGQFDVIGLLPAQYFVRELDPNDNIHPSGPTVVPVLVNSRDEHVWKPGAAQLGDHDPQNEVENPNLLFGNYIEGSIHGCVFEDLNLNMIHNSNEDAVGAVEVRLSGPGGPFTLTTDTSGLFDFTGLKPGTYVVEAVNANGWLPTETPTTIVLYSGEEMVHEDGAAGAIASNQVEVNIGQDLFLGVRKANRAVADIAGAVDGAFNNVQDGEVQNSEALELALENSGRRMAAELSLVADEADATDRVFFDMADDTDSNEEDDVNLAFLA